MTTICDRCRQPIAGRFLHNLRKEYGPSLKIWVQRKAITIPLVLITHMQSKSKRTTITCINGNTYTIETPLKTFESDMFIRLHRNTLANKNHIISLDYTGTDTLAILRTDVTLLISREQRKKVRSLFPLRAVLHND